MTAFETRLNDKTVRVGVIGLGYVGLPLVNAFWQAGLRAVGFDIDPGQDRTSGQGRDYIKHFAPENVRAMNASGRFSATADFAKLSEVDAVLICVPTPLNAAREPDLCYVTATTEMIAKHLHKDMLVVLESTTYPRHDDRGRGSDPREAAVEARHGRAPRLLAGTRRPGQRLRDAQNPQDRRRHRRAVGPGSRAVLRARLRRGASACAIPRPRRP